MTEKTRYTFEELIEAARGITFPAREKSKLRKDLIRFMNERPVGLVERRSQESRLVSAGLFRFWSRSLGRWGATSYIAALVLILVGLGGTVSVAAERALPGDRLYPVKLYLNESFQGYFAVSEKSKAYFELERVERRLAEVEALAADGRISTDTQLAIQTNLGDHLVELETHLDSIRAKQDSELVLDIAGNLEVSLNTHRDIINQIGQESTAYQSVLVPFELYLSSVSDETVKGRETDEEAFRGLVGGDFRQSAEEKIVSAQNILGEVLHKSLRLDDRFNTQTETTITAYLDEARGLETQARSAFRVGKYTDAILFAQACIRVASQADLMIDAQVKLISHQKPLMEVSQPVKPPKSTELPVPTKVLKINGI